MLRTAAKWFESRRRSASSRLLRLQVSIGAVDQQPRQREFSDIPIVLISATLSGHANQLEAIRWASADGFIREPVDPASLASTLWKVLGPNQA